MISKSADGHLWKGRDEVWTVTQSAPIRGSDSDFMQRSRATSRAQRQRGGKKCILRHSSKPLSISCHRPEALTQRGLLLPSPEGSRDRGRAVVDAAPSSLPGIQWCTPAPAPLPTALRHMPRTLHRPAMRAATAQQANRSSPDCLQSWPRCTQGMTGRICSQHQNTPCRQEWVHHRVSQEERKARR